MQHDAMSINRMNYSKSAVHRCASQHEMYKAPFLRLRLHQYTALELPRDNMRELPRDNMRTF
jgi:hypothetical protein